ncbi:hypothetical protein EVAR_16237_1 [Eumeta japonica]|uniref:ATP-dependent DNA helicase n=1 Tax=Eumeta variegata TaxID=151549 RepID=A0A4C1U5V0_EUMVA|nr:hypothetical protein EVAR_16237_1 [Eumeta japonica]
MWRCGLSEDIVTREEKSDLSRFGHLKKDLSNDTRAKQRTHKSEQINERVSAYGGYRRGRSLLWKSAMNTAPKSPPSEVVAAAVTALVSGRGLALIQRGGLNVHFRFGIKGLNKQNVSTTRTVVDPRTSESRGGRAVRDVTGRRPGPFFATPPSTASVCGTTPIKSTMDYVTVGIPTRFKTKLRSTGKIALAVPSSGTAATLLEAEPHSRDEVTVESETSVEALNRKMRDLRSKNSPIGGCTIWFSGDLRQILPVVIRDTRADEINAPLKRSYLWSHVNELEFKINMRISLSSRENSHFYNKQRRFPQCERAVRSPIINHRNREEDRDRNQKQDSYYEILYDEMKIREEIEMGFKIRSRPRSELRAGTGSELGA